MRVRDNADYMPECAQDAYKKLTKILQKDYRKLAVGLRE